MDHETTAVSYQQTIHDDVSERLALVLTKVFFWTATVNFFVWEFSFLDSRPRLVFPKENEHEMR